MEKLVADGLVKSIGVSNFSVKKIKARSSAQSIVCQTQCMHKATYFAVIAEDRVSRVAAGPAGVCAHPAGCEPNRGAPLHAQ